MKDLFVIEVEENYKSQEEKETPIFTSFHNTIVCEICKCIGHSHMPCPNKKSNSELKANFHSRQLLNIVNGMMKDNESIILENRELKLVCKTQAQTIENFVHLTNYQNAVIEKLKVDLEKAISMTKNPEFFYEIPYRFTKPSNGGLDR